jgi:hypothetical protein
VPKLGAQDPQDQFHELVFSTHWDCKAEAEWSSLTAVTQKWLLSMMKARQHATEERDRQAEKDLHASNSLLQFCTCRLCFLRGPFGVYLISAIWHVSSHLSCSASHVQPLAQSIRIMQPVFGMYNNNVSVTFVKNVLYMLCWRWIPCSCPFPGTASESFPDVRRQPACVSGFLCLFSKAAAAETSIALGADMRRQPA